VIAFIKMLVYVWLSKRFDFENNNRNKKQNQFFSSRLLVCLKVTAKCNMKSTKQNLIV